MIGGTSATIRPTSIFFRRLGAKRSRAERPRSTVFAKSRRKALARVSRPDRSGPAATATENRRIAFARSSQTGIGGLGATDERKLQPFALDFASIGGFDARNLGL